MSNAQYDSISKSYTSLVKTDPQKKFVQYPSALEFLGDISGLNVLDVGCGSGAFTELLAERGATVVAYDISPEQIDNAKKNTAGVEYFVSCPEEFKFSEKFDKAVSVLVLHYAKDLKQLEQFFHSTSEALKENGVFVCLVPNPNFKRIGCSVYNRRFSKLANGKMQVDFLDLNQNISCSAEYSDFSIDDYEQCAAAGGFNRLKWEKVKVAPEGISQMGKEYWDSFEEDCLYIALIAHK